MIEVFLLILSVVLLSGAILGAFISGVWFGGRKPQEKPLDERSRRSIEKMQSNLQNFLTYDGTEQRR